MAGSSGKPLQRSVCNARRRCSFFTGRANNWQNISATQRQGEAAVHFSRQVFSPGQRFNRRRSLITGRKCPQNSPPVSTEKIFLFIKHFSFIRIKMNPSSWFTFGEGGCVIKRWGTQTSTVTLRPLKNDISAICESFSNFDKIFSPKNVLVRRINKQEKRAEILHVRGEGGRWYLIADCISSFVSRDKPTASPWQDPGDSVR